MSSIVSVCGPVRRYFGSGAGVWGMKIGKIPLLFHKFPESLFFSKL